MPHPGGRPKGAKNNPNRIPIDFKQSNVRRAIKAVQSMDLSVASVEVDQRTGKITVNAGPRSEPKTTA
jgi:hypothetical protein